MYLVDNKLIDLILERTDKKYITLFARLAPSMKVIQIQEVLPTFEYFNEQKLQKYVDTLNISDFTTETNCIVEQYTYDRTATPAIWVGSDDSLLIYHPYIKEQDERK